MTVLPTPTPVGIDTSKASAIPCLFVEEHSVLATLSLGHLLELVPDPEKLEDKKLRPSMLADPTLAKHIEERERIQRLFTGEKKRNKVRYAEFIKDRVTTGKHRGTPPILLGTTAKLTVIQGADGTAKVGLPFGRKLISVDGETQRAAWTHVNTELLNRLDAGEPIEELLDSIRVAVEIHHGLSLDELTDMFYWRNVLGTAVNKNEALSRDNHDSATNIARHVMEQVIVKPDGGHIRIAKLVQQQSRQVGKNAPEWLTFSALRTCVVTAMYGKAGFQYGSRPVPSIDGADFDKVRDEVTAAVVAVLQRFAVQFENKADYLIGAPSLMGGIGVLIHTTLQSLPGAVPAMSLDAMLEHLAEIRWEREGFWDGVATRQTPSGATTVAGPKEVGYAVADAVVGTGNPTAVARVRGREPGQRIPANQPTMPIFAQS